jgi:SOS regulatory protein LexA
MPRHIDFAKHIGLLRHFHAQHHRLPSYSEMIDLLGYRSKNGVFGLVNQLVAQGYLTKEGRKLAPTAKLTGTIQLLGTVQAGFPSPAEEELVDTMSLDDFLIERPEATFMLKVTGDSMIEAGIHPDDLVLIEKGRTPRNGDIVVAAVDGEWTMKYFIKEQGKVRLEPANPRFSTIHPRHSLEVAGVVRSVIRKYT